MPLWLLSLISNRATKVIGVILIITSLFGGVYLYHRNGYNTGYRVGYAQSLKDNPPNVYNGPSTINQQPQITYSLLGIKIGKIGFGFIKEK